MRPWLSARPGNSGRRLNLARFGRGGLAGPDGRLVWRLLFLLFQVVGLVFFRSLSAFEVGVQPVGDLVAVQQRGVPADGFFQFLFWRVNLVDGLFDRFVRVFLQLLIKEMG